MKHPLKKERLVAFLLDDEAGHVTCGIIVGQEVANSIPAYA